MRKPGAVLLRGFVLRLDAGARLRADFRQQQHLGVASFLADFPRRHQSRVVPVVVIGIEPDQWIIDNYLPEAHAPAVTAKIINAARKKRGETPVPKEAEQVEDRLVAQ